MNVPLSCFIVPIVQYSNRAPVRLRLPGAFQTVINDDRVVVAAGDERRSIGGIVQRINLVLVFAKKLRNRETSHRRLRQSHPHVLLHMEKLTRVVIFL